MSVVAALFATKILFTGVVGFVPSAKNDHLVRVIAPNGRVPNNFERSNKIPSHTAYILFRMADLETDSPRKADYTFITDGVRYGVVAVESEYLKLGGNFRREALEYEREPVPPGDDAPTSQNADSLYWMFDHDRAVTEPLSVDPSLLIAKPAPEKVTLRLNLDYGTFKAEPASISRKFSFISSSNLTCQSVARAVVATLADGGQESNTLLTISSTPFRGTDAKPVLRFARKKADGDLRIVIGNEPLGELERSIDLLLPAPAPATPAVAPTAEMVKATAEHDAHMAAAEGGRRHMLLMKRILDKCSPDPFVPVKVDAALCVNGMYTGEMSPPQGQSGGCSPSKVSVADPN